MNSEDEGRAKKIIQERMNPLNDYLFMKYMGEKGDEEQLISFLNAVLQKTGRAGIVSVEILEDKTHTAEFIGDKASILDVRAKMTDGTKVNIEVQVRNVSNMDRRSLFYWCREYSKGIGSGQQYEELPNVIAINILGQEFLPIDEVHASFHLWEDVRRDYRLTDALELHFIDMVKFQRLENKDIEHNMIHRWLTFFDCKTDDATINRILDMDKAIKKVQDIITVVRQDSEMYRAYQMRELALMDFNSSVSTAEKKGIAIGKQEGRQEGIAIGEQRGIAIGEQRGRQEGIAIGEQKGIAIGEQRGIAIGKQEGRQEERKEHVLRLSQNGFSAIEIAKFTNLPVEEIEEILKNN
ncbi:MAG: Rpn family recombination-promoting nuclease/putative transposase [Prevotella sp.]|jgi:predicted transposase/invertase (TIGR01784 family)|nr:Rpn family recombination-promoting nuclease/putative transposase [Prevotella sp.]